MPVAQLVNAVRGHWRLVVVMAVAGAAIFGSLALVQRPEYRAEMRILVAFGSIVPAGTSSVDVAARLGVDRRLVESRVRTYAQQLSSPIVTDPIVTNLQLPYSPDELGGQIRALSPLNSTFIDVVVVDRDPVRVLAICDAIAAVLADIARREDRSASIVAAPDILVVDRATVARETNRIWWGLHLVGGMVGGFAIGVGLASLLAERRREISRRENNRRESSR
jgi:capsular polysaccharide biosynthesis protein